ncbi:Uncharacterized protein HZ326_30391 [Fusarium oxysporum f. sp. albedinis]|nr:Uncharacterized protein HZ326_30391 [Fusarium oxysporum f. sp. albedinis]
MAIPSFIPQSSFRQTTTRHRFGPLPQGLCPRIAALTGPVSRQNTSFGASLCPTLLNKQLVFSAKQQLEGSEGREQKPFTLR